VRMAESCKLRYFNSFEFFDYTPFKDTVRALLRALTERTVRTSHSVSTGAQ
jgi:hypothetical protein